MTRETDSPEHVHDLLPQEDAPVEAAAPLPAMVPAKTERPSAQDALPAIQTPSLAEVYSQAGVRVPPHGFSILKIAEMLSSVHIRELPPDAKRAAVLLTLEASNIQVNEVTEDAARRERVLNDYEARQLQILQNYKNGKAQQSQEMQAEIERLIEQLRLLIQANEKEVASEKNRMDEWRTRKREEERKIRTAASLFAPTLAQQPANDTIPIPPVPQPDAPAAAAPTGMRSPAMSPSTDNNAGKPSTRPSLWKR